MAAPNARALADTLAALLVDEREREALGARSRAFSEQEMAVERTARATRTLLDQALGATRARPG
jgi:hypothetical protein